MTNQIDSLLQFFFLKPSDGLELRAEAFWSHFYTLSKLDRSRLLVEIDKQRSLFRSNMKFHDAVDPYVNSLSRYEISLLIKLIVNEFV